MKKPQRKESAGGAVRCYNCLGAGFVTSGVGLWHATRNVPKPVHTPCAHCMGMGYFETPAKKGNA